MQGHGCPKCAVKKLATKRLKSLEEFIEDAVQIHGDKYDYSESEYVGSHKKIKIFCKKCNEFFWQKPNDHLRKPYGIGCPTCQNFKGEEAIKKFLVENNINYEKEKSFEDLFDKDRNHPLRFDFYIPSKKLLIEYQGIQHFEPIDFSGNKTIRESEEALIERQHRDQLKRDYCVRHGIAEVEINYKDYENIENILRSALS